VWNDPASPNCTYGFTDTVAKQGHLLFTSLLLLDAARGMATATAQASCGGGGNSTFFAELAATVSAGLAAATQPGTAVGTSGTSAETGTGTDAGSGTGGILWNPQYNMLNACSDGANALPDVWGSALAVAMGVLDNKTATAVVTAIAAKSGVFSAGQVRHLPPPLVWGLCFGGGCPSPGTLRSVHCGVCTRAGTSPTLPFLGLRRLCPSPSTRVRMRVSRMCTGVTVFRAPMISNGVTGLLPTLC
jgi:hypothetical protein